MRYPALIDFDGERLVAVFPDCPGCQASVGPDGDIVAAARAALQRWLETALTEGASPPRPSIAVVSRDWFEWVDVEPDLERRLLLHWVVARRLSRRELARRSGVSEEDVAALQDERRAPPPELLERVARALGGLGGPPPRATATTDAIRPRRTRRARRPQRAEPAPAPIPARLAARRSTRARRDR